MPRTSRRAAVLLLALVSLPLPALAQTAATPAAVVREAPDPTVARATSMGAVGVRESIRGIMQRQAVLRAEGIVLKDHESEVEQPDRRGLPQNPLSPLNAGTSAKGGGAQLESGGFQVLSPQTVGTSFTGATLAGVNPTLSFPPDCMGAVGPTQYVLFVNGRLVTFSKSTGTADGVLNADPDVFFSSVINGSSTSDPRIRYDRLSGRWFLVIINVSTPNRILIAVSDASSSTLTLGTTFTFFFVDIATTPPAISNACLADYPTLGVDNNALYIGTNNFCPSYNSSDGYVIRKSSILGAGPIVVTVFRGLVPSAAGAGPYTPQGVDNYSPTANEGYFIGVDNATFGTLMLRRVADPGGTPTVGTNQSITVSATQFPIVVNHLGNTGGTGGRLSALDDRLFAAHIRGGHLWTAHNIGVNNTGAASGTLTRDGSRWYELNVPVGSGAPTLLQSGTVFTASATNSTDQRSYWIPTVMVSGQNHVAMSMSAAGTSDRANAATVGRLSADGSGTMGTPALITSSATAYNPPSDPGGSQGRRWGDYSYVSLDPLDDMTMWAVHMFCDATNSYGVRITKLIAPPPATPGSIADVTAGQSSVVVTLTGTSVSGSGFYDPGANLSAPALPFQHLSATITNGAATGTPPTVTSATFVSPTSLQLTLNTTAATPSVGAERYTVNVINPDGQTAAAAILRVLPNGPVVTLAAGPSLAEGNAGTTSFPFTINVSPTSASPITVRYQTSDGTATVADADYAAVTDSVVIAANQSSAGFNVSVNGDPKREPDETFTVTLTGASGGTVGVPASATGTIQNDDPVPTLSIAASNVAEGNSGTMPMSFTVSLSNPSSTAVSATWATSDGTAKVADGDYASGGGTVSVAAGATTGSLAVTVNGDTRFESNESFNVTLSAPSGATLGTALGVGTIQNDDLAPTVSIGNAGASEGNAGTSPLALTATLSAASGLPVTVDYATGDSTATLANGDYQSASGTLTFPAGTTTQPVNVTVNGDVTLESDETFVVRLSNPSGAAIDVPEGVGTIVNDDGVPSLSVADANVAEGNSGTSAMVFDVSLSNPTDQPVSVAYAVTDGTATLASGDYVGASGTLVVPAKTTLGQVTVDVNGDVCGEPNETLILHLGSPAGATIADSLATGTIQNDDDVTAPLVAVLVPNGGETLTAGVGTAVQWTASDNVAVTSVDLLLSRDGGATYPEVLASGVANTGSFAWTPSGPTTTTAFVRVVAHDAGCNAAADSSDAAFTITDPTTAVGGNGPITSFALGTIRPNPSHGAIEVDYQLPREASVRLMVVDVQGREIATLAGGRIAVGRYSGVWTGSTAVGPVPRGAYFVRFTAEGRTYSKRFVLIR